MVFFEVQWYMNTVILQNQLKVPWYYYLTPLLYHGTATVLFPAIPNYDITWSSIALVSLYISTTLFLGHSSVCVCVCLYPLSTVTPLVQEESRTAHHVCLIFHLCQTHRPPPPCPSLFVSTDSRLALNIHGGCQPLAHTKAGPGPRGLGQGGWRSRAHAERDSQVCAFVYAREREKERERPFPLPSSASPSGIREQQWKGKREGQKDRSVLWSMRAHTHLSSTGAQGDAQASALPSLPETQVAY